MSYITKIDHGSGATSDLKFYNHLKLSYITKINHGSGATGDLKMKTYYNINYNYFNDNRDFLINNT